MEYLFYYYASNDNPPLSINDMRGRGVTPEKAEAARAKHEQAYPEDRLVFITDQDGPIVQELAALAFANQRRESDCTCCREKLLDQIKEHIWNCVDDFDFKE